MNGTSNRLCQIAVTVLMATILTAAVRVGEVSADRYAGTPTPTWSCDMATPQASPEGMDGMDMGTMGTPASNMPTDMGEMEFDQLYIDVMISHHASIIALAQAAIPRLTDERLIEIATNIVANQSNEITELRRYRQAFYGEAEPMALDDLMMNMMMEAMPGMGEKGDMAFQMDAQAQVNAFCAAEDPDLTLIDMVIPHHEMAIISSEVALKQAVHQEIKDFAQRVIDDQQAEIDELNAIRAELTG